MINYKKIEKDRLTTGPVLIRKGVPYLMCYSQSVVLSGIKHLCMVLLQLRIRPFSCLLWPLFNYFSFLSKQDHKDGAMQVPTVFTKRKYTLLQSQLLKPEWVQMESRECTTHSIVNGNLFAIFLKSGCEWIFCSCVAISWNFKCQSSLFCVLHFAFCVIFGQVP